MCNDKQFVQCALTNACVQNKTNSEIQEKQESNGVGDISSLF